MSSSNDAYWRYLHKGNHEAISFFVNYKILRLLCRYGILWVSKLMEVKMLFIQGDPQYGRLLKIKCSNFIMETQILLHYR
jgi:hypothetical protein